MRRPIINGYGALELKMKYQRNMLLGNLFAVTLAVMFIVSLYIYSELNPVEDIDPPLVYVPITVDIPPPNSLVIERDQPGKGAVVSRLGQFLSSSPILVGDDDPVGDDISFPTRYEKQMMVGTGVPDDDYDGKPGILPGAAVEDDYMGALPFVSREIEPVMIMAAKPEYPKFAKELGIEGDVWVAVLVGTDGRVAEAKLFKDSGLGQLLEKAALEAALKCRFSPAIQNGIPITVWVSFRFSFTLDR